MRYKIESELGWGYGYLIGVAGLVLAAVSIYYARAQHKRETQGTVKPHESGESKSVNIIKDPVVTGKPATLDSL